MRQANNLSNRQVLETRCRNARHNLLYVVIFTLVNILLLITKSDLYFLFSAYIPYVLVSVGMMLCGMYPPEYYGQDISNVEFMNTSVFAILLAVALIITALYFISWIFSKKNKVGWFIFALVIFVIDTVGMLWSNGLGVEGIVDIIFHVWVIVSLALGINAYFKLKKLSVEEVENTEIEQNVEEQESLEDSVILRIADTNVKARILLESNVQGHLVTYRRVKRVNELVVDGNVYDEIEVLVEFAHSLKAQIDGHLIEVGFDGKFHSYLKVDGQIVAKQLRLY